MAKIPYQPFSTERPMEGTGTRGFDVRTSAAQFGGGVGEALAHFGQTLEHTGDELFSRATAMKELDNRNGASNASADYTDWAGDVLENHKTLNGQHAVDNLPVIRDQLRERREAIRAGLGNDSARRYFDAESRGTYNSTVRAASTWSAAQHRQATDAADQAQVRSISKNASFNAEDDTQVEAKLKDLDKVVEAQLRNKGYDEATVKQGVFEARSAALSETLVALSERKPFEASDRLERYAKAGQLSQSDINRIQDRIDTKRRLSGTRQIVAGIRNGSNYAVGNRIVPIEYAKEAIGTFESDNKYWLKSKVETKWGHALGRYQVMSGLLPQFLMRNGMKPMSEQEFLNDPKAQDELFEKMFGQYMQETGSFNEAASKWFTGGSIAEARAKRAHDPLGTDVDKYLRNTNAVLGKTLPERDIMRVAEEAGNKLVPPDQDPQFLPALQGEVIRQGGIDRKFRAEQKTEDLNTIIAGLSALQPDGSYTQTREQLLSTPQAVEAYGRMTPKERDKVEDWLQNNIKGGYPDSPEKQRQATELRGMLSTFEGRTEFAKKNLMDYKFPNPVYKELSQLQRNITSKGEDDPRIKTLLQDGFVQAKMFDLGVTKKQNESDYYVMLGTVQRMLDNEQRAAGAPLNHKQMMDVWNEAVKQKVTQGWMSWLTGGALGSETRGPPFITEGKQADPQLWNMLMQTPGFRSLSDQDKAIFFNEMRHKRLMSIRKKEAAE